MTSTFESDIDNIEMARLTNILVMGHAHTPDRMVYLDH